MEPGLPLLQALPLVAQALAGATLCGLAWRIRGRAYPAPLAPSLTLLASVLLVDALLRASTHGGVTAAGYSQTLAIAATAVWLVPLIFINAFGLPRGARTRDDATRKPAKGVGPSDTAASAPRVLIPAADTDRSAPGMRELLERNAALAAELEARRGAELRLRRIASRDALSGLPNQRYMEAVFEHLKGLGERQRSRLAVCFIDLDDFKQVNDTYGHAAGDQVLAESGKRLRTALRRADVVGRIGGDEFLALLPNTSAAGVAALLGKLRDVMGRPHRWTSDGTEHAITIGLSIGVAICPDHGGTFAELRHRADAAMYRAKRSGKNQFAIYRPGDAPSARPMSEGKSLRATG